MTELTRIYAMRVSCTQRDECRTRKHHAANNLAMMRHATLNLLTREPSKIPNARAAYHAAQQIEDLNERSPSRRLQATRRISTLQWRRCGGHSSRDLRPASPQGERSRLVWRLGDLLEQHADEFAELELLDNGKPITNARREGAGASLTVRAKSFASCSDCAERTGFRFESKHVCGAFRGTERRTDDPLAPAIAPIRGSRQ